MFQQFVERVFGGDAPRGDIAIYQVVVRAFVVYVAGILIVRVGKSRVIGRVTSLDIILGFILGSVLGGGITGHAAISDTLVASATLVATHWLLTIISCRSHKAGIFLKGSPVLLIDNGKVLLDAMREAHISGHDLEEGLRLHGIESFADVKVAYKERNGEISVIKKQPSVND